MCSEQENNNYFKANFFLGFPIMSVSLSLSASPIPTPHQEVGRSTADFPTGFGFDSFLTYTPDDTVSTV